MLVNISLNGTCRLPLPARMTEQFLGFIYGNGVVYLNDLNCRWTSFDDLVEYKTGDP